MNAAPSTPAPPTISLLSLVLPGVPTGPPITITNPLRELLPVDLAQPLVPQLLPAPLVAVLMALQELIPFTSFVISPVLNFVVPPVLANVICTPFWPTSWCRPFPAARVPQATDDRDWTVVPRPPTESASRQTRRRLTWCRWGWTCPQSPQHDIVPVITYSSRTTAEQQRRVADEQSRGLPGRLQRLLAQRGLAQITAIAVPGAVAILFFTVGGGFIGYRQARAGHVIRAERITRFLR